MTGRLLLLAVCGLVVATGCLGGSPNSSPTPSATPPPTPSATPPPTPSAQAVAGQAIFAEKSRIERQADDYENLTDLSFGILVPPESEVLRRNETGVVVRVTVGYSIEMDCDGDGEPESSTDGANTNATYFGTEERVRLLEVSQDFLDPERHC